VIFVYEDKFFVNGKEDSVKETQEGCLSRNEIQPLFILCKSLKSATPLQTGSIINVGVRLAEPGPIVTQKS
jgi:hypothetical protein